MAHGHCIRISQKTTKDKDEVRGRGRGEEVRGRDGMRGWGEGGKGKRGRQT